VGKIEELVNLNRELFGIYKNMKKEIIELLVDSYITGFTDAIKKITDMCEATKDQEEMKKQLTKKFIEKGLMNENTK